MKPNQPNQRRNVPKVAKGKFEPGIGVILPSSEYLPFLAPSIIAPVKAAHPPTPWTIDDPAKSKKPASLKKPPPQDQEPWIGYINPQSKTTNTKKLFNLILSATAPLTIEAAVAQKTIWKNQSEPEEYVESSSPPKLFNSSEGPHTDRDPIQPDTSIYIKL